MYIIFLLQRYSKRSTILALFDVQINFYLIFLDNQWNHYFHRFAAKHISDLIYHFYNKMCFTAKLKTNIILTIIAQLKLIECSILVMLDLYRVVMILVSSRVNISLFYF